MLENVAFVALLLCILAFGALIIWAAIDDEDFKKEKLNHE